MFKTIMVPVDLNDATRMDKALAVAADLAQRHGASAHLVGVTPSQPSEVARTPEAFAERLASFAAERAAVLGTKFETRVELGNDLTRDLDAVLTRAAEAIGADLVVMASHKPGLAEYLFASNAGYMASHAEMSVFVVRD